jgi:hypothetical protein
MTSTWRVLLFIIVIMSLLRPAYAQQAQTVTITEPGIIALESLFQMADTVALVKVVSGDTQNYPTAIYKGEVVKSFKGAPAGQTIYFGPYVGTRLGWDYVLFLRNVAKPLAPNPTSSVNYGTVSYSEVFNEGYSSMETSYECVFDGKDTAQQCDYAVRVCTDYIKLPKSLHTFPPMTEDTPFGCRSVRKEALFAVLRTLHEWRK